jgi:hypothetical protein
MPIFATVRLRRIGRDAGRIVRIEPAERLPGWLVALTRSQEDCATATARLSPVATVIVLPASIADIPQITASARGTFAPRALGGRLGAGEKLRSQFPLVSPDA